MVSTSTDTPSPDHVNIASHLSRMARLLPDKAALIVCTGRDRRTAAEPMGRCRYKRITFAQLDAASDRYAHGFAAAGLGRGVKVAVLLKPGEDFFAVVFALFKVGAVQVMIDPGMGLRNMLRCLEEIQPHGLIGIPAAIALKKLTFSLRSVRTIITAGRRWFWGGPRLRDMHDAAPAAPFTPADTRRDEDAAILFTSGSTGLAKGVVYQHGMFDAQVAALRDQYGIAPDEVDLATFPPFALFDPAMGMTAVIPHMDFRKPGSVFPPNIIEPILEHGVTHMFGSPALLNRVGQFGAKAGVKLPSLRRVISAGAPVPPPVLSHVRQMLAPDVHVHTPYGATESLPVATISSAEILGETAALTALGHGTCVGRPVGNITVRTIRITDTPIETWSDDLLVPPGTPGEIVVRGPVVTHEYAARPEATRLAKIACTPDPTHASPAPATAPEGPSATGVQRPALVWHRMGDIGCFDGQGRLWFYGRKAHRVNGLRDGVPHTWFTDPCEGIFNALLPGLRTALVGLRYSVTTPATASLRIPVMVVEGNSLIRGVSTARERVLAARRWPALRKKLREVLDQHEPTRGIKRVALYSGSFPVDIRHNSKIFREKLADWMEGQPASNRGEIAGKE
ncbi:peptide synthase [Verrucomicrobia bacterium LW23]|nr:peptide synthase [Verrucomicrobia bacterium LW23]